MSLRGVSPTAECSHHAFQSFAPSVPSFHFTSSKKDRPVSLVVLSNPFVSKTLSKSHSSIKVSRNHSFRRSCTSNSDDIYLSFRIEGLAKNSSNGADSHGEGGHRKNKKLHCEISKNNDSDSPSVNKNLGRTQDSFLNTRFDFLEPMMLGIRPEFPDRPDQETVLWATIEHKAKSFDIPLSLRMIKKKLQWEEGLIDSKELTYCSVKTAFSSMVFIIIELQSCALHMREALCDEDLESITAKVQKEMHSSFVWLFQQVFSRTPALMLQVMTLLANFGVYSASRNIGLQEASTFIEQINSSLSSLGTVEEKTKMPQSDSAIYSVDELGSAVEMNLWNSMLDDASKMHREGVDEKVLDHDTAQYFVSPVSVELEPDGYEDYLRTDLLYQMNLSQEPNNPLLLCNYAQFLHLVARDYDRAEECFKRAVQVLPPDAESLTQYANFLWTVRKDVFGAEESFLQALAIEPDNSYYASRYANFLWSTGGEETCFPLNNSHDSNL